MQVCQYLCLFHVMGVCFFYVNMCMYNMSVHMFVCVCTYVCVCVCVCICLNVCIRDT